MVLTSSAPSRPSPPLQRRLLIPGSPGRTRPGLPAEERITGVWGQLPADDLRDAFGLGVIISKQVPTRPTSGCRKEGYLGVNDGQGKFCSGAGLRREFSADVRATGPIRLMNK